MIYSKTQITEDKEVFTLDFSCPIHIATNLENFFTFALKKAVPNDDHLIINSISASSV